MIDSQLIFIISAPRSGSSLLQQILSSHKSIRSLPETWLMLPLVYLLKDDTDGQSCYNENFAKVNISNYLSSLKNGKDKFIERIKNIALETYADSIVDNNTPYFLDKTPRYYHIIPELIEWFPKAKIILIARNPASVFCSIMDYSFSGTTDWLQNKDRIHDLFTAPLKLYENQSNKNVLFITYENIVTNTESTIENIIEYLGLIPNKQILKGSYSLGLNFKKTNSIDTKSVHKHNLPVDHYINSWKNSVNTYQKKSLLLEYIEHLDENIFENFGYSLTNIKKEIKGIKVRWKPFKLSLKLSSFNYGKGLSIGQHLYLSILNRLRNK